MNGSAPAIGDLEHLSGLLLSLHRLSHSVAFAQFQAEALALLAGALPFDAAWWGLASGVSVHTEVRHNLPDSYLGSWERVKLADPIAAATTRAPGVTVCFNADALAPYTELQATLAGYDVHHVLCTKTTEPALELFAFVSLYRTHAPFTEAERRLKQAVTPHLHAALHQTWRRHLETSVSSTDADARPRASAICDASGLILSAEDHFARLMSLEWPRWRGPRLPEAVMTALARRRDLRGRRLRLDFRETDGVTLVRAQERSHLSDLSPREHVVAELYATGRTYKEIAQDLGVAPATARHYIRSAFNKLRVRNKAELTRIFVR
ncbi:helix-turn-helix transcriptional regulator [Stappia sp.]|uniref:helix-turn-helix transcriptional regulator n=1 Tax=Stappia sp. TaxID=1870903 RepID=UPI0032D99653